MTYRRYMLIFLISLLHFVNTQDGPVVNNTQGLIRGLVGEDGDYYMYLGIPYGVVDPKNPFGPSSPGAAFEGTFNATNDSAACPQSTWGDFLGSIDCLHLNVFVPSSPTGLLPVLIFIHGGAFISGSYGRTLHGPKFLVRHDVILVTLNYRLGPFGYMCTDNPRVPGNQASKDQLLALQWVHDNIKNFGGDPNRVTLSGNSAGGMSADLLVLRNDDHELFQQAIMQSGVAFLPSYPPTVRNSPLLLSQHLGFQTSDTDEALDFLATLEPSQILTAGQQLGIEFRPCIERSFDGVEAFMTENWLSMDTIPTAKDFRVIIGFNANEALGLFLVPTSDLTNIVTDSLGEPFVIDHDDFLGIEDVRRFYFGDEELDGSKFEEAVDLRSDASFVYNSIRSLNRYLKSGVEKAYLYLFSYDGERNLVKRNINTTLHGAAHADEMGYLFDVSYFDEITDQDQLTVDRMTEMWTNFVKYGDPTPQATPLVPVRWEAITPSSPHHYIHIDSELTVGSRPWHERMSFWDLFLEANEDKQRFLIDNAEL